MHKAAKGQDLGQSGTAGFSCGQGIPSAMDALSTTMAKQGINLSVFTQYQKQGSLYGAGSLGGIVRLVNTCGVGIAMELELMGEPISAERALACHLVNRVVPRAELMATAEDIAAKILRNPRVAVESAKETILAVAGRPLEDQLRLECLYSYSIMGDPEIAARKDEFLGRRSGSDA